MKDKIKELRDKQELAKLGGGEERSAWAVGKSVSTRNTPKAS